MILFLFVVEALLLGKFTDLLTESHTRFCFYDLDLTWRVFLSLDLLFDFWIQGIIIVLPFILQSDIFFYISLKMSVNTLTWSVFPKHFLRFDSLGVIGSTCFPFSPFTWSVWYLAFGVNFSSNNFLNLFNASLKDWSPFSSLIFFVFILLYFLCTGFEMSPFDLSPVNFDVFVMLFLCF